MISVFVKAIPGIDDIILNIDNPEICTQELSTLIKHHLPSVVAEKCILTLKNGSSINCYDTIQEILHVYTDASSNEIGSHFIDLELRIPICSCDK